ncbi:MAG TPA: GNAT family N-acetyltransferase, partial [Actinopolymorphaceae bacterium]|nr:GNAT family N-acetyltransferase [Actinopolymorphaceae bacterium]
MADDTLMPSTPSTQTPNAQTPSIQTPAARTEGSLAPGAAPAGSRTIRRVTGEELLTTAYPLQAYAFDATPRPAGAHDRWRKSLPYRQDNAVLVAFGDGQPEAVVVGISLRQNVRGRIVPMVGISGVATHPAARRRGHVRALLDQLHGEMRDAGHVVSTLYPFRMSFYERFGYAGFPKPRSVRLFADGLGRMRDVDVPGEVTFHQIGDVFDDYHAFTEQLLAERHGFSVFPHHIASELGNSNDHWVAFARHEGEIVGALLYRTSGFGDELRGRHFLARGLVGRTLLLQWLAVHADQYASFTFELPPDERPDLWYVGIRYTDETRIAAPTSSAPMGRVLSLDGLAGIAAGPAQVTVEVVEDQFVGGIWTLDGSTGVLDVGAARAPSSAPTATLTSHGLAALVYGVLDPAEIPLLGY